MKLQLRGLRSLGQEHGPDRRFGRPRGARPRQFLSESAESLVKARQRGPGPASPGPGVVAALPTLSTKLSRPPSVSSSLQTHSPRITSHRSELGTRPDKLALHRHVSGHRHEGRRLLQSLILKLYTGPVYAYKNHTRELDSTLYGRRSASGKERNYYGFEEFRTGSGDRASRLQWVNGQVSRVIAIADSHQRVAGGTELARALVGAGRGQDYRDP